MNRKDYFINECHYCKSMAIYLQAKFSETGEEDYFNEMNDWLDLADGWMKLFNMVAES